MRIHFHLANTLKVRAKPSTLRVKYKTKYSLQSEISVLDFVLSTKFVLRHRHLFPIGGSITLRDMK
jgi:hypothetical protein